MRLLLCVCPRYRDGFRWQCFSRLISQALNGAYPASLLTYISQHDDTNSVLWDYFTSHVEEVVYGVPSFSAFISAATSSWNSAQHLSAVSST